MRLEDRAEQATHRMFEFYSKTELTQYVDHCRVNDIPPLRGMLFLDGQTRANYLVDSQEPSIIDYMVSVYNHYRDNSDS